MHVCFAVREIPLHTNTFLGRSKTFLNCNDESPFTIHNSIQRLLNYRFRNSLHHSFISYIYSIACVVLLIRGVYRVIIKRFVRGVVLSLYLWIGECFCRICTFPYDAIPSNAIIDMFICMVFFSFFFVYCSMYIFCCVDAFSQSVLLLFCFVRGSNIK